MRLKHNKKRNTAFLYESLVREVVINSVRKDTNKRNTVVLLVKENFGKTTEMNKELELYKVLLETKNINLRTAEKLLYEIKRSHARLNKKKLFKEQSTLIKLINKNLSKNVFSNFVPNYKSLATVFQIFDEDVSGKTRVILEEEILKTMVSTREKEIKENAISNLTLKTFTANFNETYSHLLQEQRELLNKYILSFLDNGVEFKIYLNEEVGRLQKSINDSLILEEIQGDSSMQTKVHSVLGLIETFKTTPINEDILKHVLKMQMLAKEMQN